MCSTHVVICWCCSKEASVGPALCEKANLFSHPAISYSLVCKQPPKYKFYFLCFCNNLELSPPVSWVYWYLKKRIRDFWPWPRKWGHAGARKISQTQGALVPSPGTKHVCCKIRRRNQHIVRWVIVPVCNDTYMDLGGGRRERVRELQRWLKT